MDTTPVGQPDAALVFVDERTADFDDALARVMGRVKPAPKDGIDRNTMKEGKPRRYSSLPAVYEACREALDAEGFAYPQWPSVAEDGAIWVETHLRRKGVAIVRKLRFPLQGQMVKGGESFRPATIQDVGKAITYARRYSLTAMLGIVSEDDDDGHQASHEPVDRLWQAFETKRNALCQVMKTDAKAVTRLVREAAGITHDREPSDPEVEAMIAAAEHMLTPPREPLTPGPDRERAAVKGEQTTEPAASKAKRPAAKKPPKFEAADLPSWISDQAQADAFRAWRKAGQAVIDHRTRDYREANGEGPSEGTIAAFRADILRVSASVCGVERFDPKTAGAEGLTLAADALVQDLEARAQQGRAA